MPKWLPDLLAVLALALVATGVALIWVPAAFIVAGLGLGLIAWRLGVTS